jgi:hypothetical protein
VDPIVLSIPSGGPAGSQSAVVFQLPFADCQINVVCALANVPESNNRLAATPNSSAQPLRPIVFSQVFIFLII